MDVRHYALGGQPATTIPLSLAGEKQASFTGFSVAAVISARIFPASSATKKKTGTSMVPVDSRFSRSASGG
jgi:hypothetical protein